MTSEEFHAALHLELRQPIEPAHTTQVGHIVTKVPARDRGHRAPWAYATVDLQNQRVQIQVNLNLKRNSLSEADYQKLTALVFRGIRQYWSRTVKVGGRVFAVQVNALYATGRAVGVDLVIAKARGYARSSNPRILGMDATFYYNAGAYHTPQESDADFMQVAAHEFGHAVLMAVGGLGYSWTHKGSTSLFQNVKNSTAGYPSAGEIDLMRYYDFEKSPDIDFPAVVSRSMADEWDVKCLLLVSQRHY